MPSRSAEPGVPGSRELDLARTLGLGRAADLFPDDVIAAHATAAANRSTLPAALPAALEPWQPPVMPRP